MLRMSLAQLASVDKSVPDLSDHAIVKLHLHQLPTWASTYKKMRSLAKCLVSECMHAWAMRDYADQCCTLLAVAGAPVNAR